MALKPLFYMLAKYGPWSHHVRVSSPSVSMLVEQWLISQNKRENQDYEVLVESIQHKNSKKTFIPSKTGMVARSIIPIQPIFFFNDPALATYVKLTWG